MIIDVENYRISPYAGNTCWKIQEKQTKEGAKAEYREPYYYPATLGSAFDKVRELISMDDEKHAKSLDEAIEQYKKITKQIQEVIESLPIQRADQLK